MSRFYVAALVCALIVPALFIVFPIAYAIVYAVFPVMLAIIFVSIPRVWSYLTDRGRPSVQDRTTLPLGYKVAIALLVAWPTLLFVFPGNKLASLLSIWALLLACVSAGISDFVRRIHRNN
jgi:hypothetical protein